MTEPNADSDFDAVIVGAGFAGLCMLHRLRGLGQSARVFEAGSGVGGTWFWNRYPGARCDVESLEYSYQFSDQLQQEWEWTERYASQPRIALPEPRRRSLRSPSDIQLNTRVVSAAFDETAGRWRIATHDGSRVSARFCIMATGCLSSANVPALKGRESFAGSTFHTGRWPHERIDFTGQRVAVIGTGSSAIQAIPYIAAEAAHLFVFQRTPNYSIPAQNHPLPAEVQRQVKAEYPAIRQRAGQMPFGFDTRPNEKSALEVTEEERRAEYEARWAKGGLPFMSAFADILYSHEANDTAAEFIRGKIRALVRDPKVAEMLSPQSVVGCKRLCSDTEYYETFNRPNVTLVDLRSTPIEEVLPHGLRTSAREYALDSLVFATGFDAMTGALTRIDIRGTGGTTLAEKWAAGPRTYLGLATAGFPNLFIITGPGSPSVLSNMVPSIEQHANWIAACIGWLREHDLTRIEPAAVAEDAWVAHVNEVANGTPRTLVPRRQHPRKPRSSCPTSFVRGARRRRRARRLRPR